MAWISECSVARLIRGGIFCICVVRWARANGLENLDRLSMKVIKIKEPKDLHELYSMLCVNENWMSFGELHLLR